MHLKSKLVVLLLSALALMGCKRTQTTNLKPQEGYIHVTGGKIWYKIVGSGNKTPLLLLHGGPGVPSYYLKPMAALSKDRPVIFFDQLGCGKSDRITDTALMTIPQYVNELKEVVDALHLKDYYLYGHSWGTILATEYYFKYPKGIKALILAGPALDIKRWQKDADTLIATLPDSLQQAIRLSEKNKTYDGPAYQQAMNVYYHKYVARKLPWSPDIDSAFSEMGENVYLYMEGPSEFTLSGQLANYDITDKLGEIKVPTLFICGEYDEARPESGRYYQSLVPGAQYAEIPDAGHLMMQDDPKDNNKVIADFLNSLK